MLRRRHYIVLCAGDVAQLVDTVDKGTNKEIRAIMTKPVNGFHYPRPEKLPIPNLSCKIT